MSHGSCFAASACRKIASRIVQSPILVPEHVTVAHDVLREEGTVGTPQRTAHPNALHRRLRDLRRRRVLALGAKTLTLPFRPGIGCLNIGNACGVYAVFSTLMLTKSALDLLRALRPTHTSIPRELRVSS